MTGRTGFISALLALLAWGLWLICGRGCLKEVVYPLENAHQWFSRTLVERVKGLCAGSAVHMENRALKEELAAFQMREADLMRLAHENVRLRRALGLKERTLAFTTNHWICAPILSREGVAGVRGLIRLGRGSLAGVKKHAPVAVPQGLVGRVEEVSLHTCDVRLLLDPALQVACEIETNDPAFGPVRGIVQGGGVQRAPSRAGVSLFYFLNPLRMRHLKREPRLLRGARVFTSGQGGVYPPGLNVGFLIEDAPAQPSSLTREVELEPAVDCTSLEDVFIHRED